VVFDVSVGGTMVAAGQAVNAVPYAHYADRVGTPDCPTGYLRNTTDPAMPTDSVLCQRQGAGGVFFDEVVRVGTGTSAFWIDRYEASVVAGADGSGMPRFQSDGDFPTGFPRNGQVVGTTPVLYAASRREVTPARYITWFQAQAACRASGKQLPTGEQWLAAGQGTPDVTPGCNTATMMPRPTGMGAGCASNWGAQDLIGNLWEWTSEWDISAGNLSVTGMWTTGYNGDGTWNVASSAYYSASDVSPGIPAASVRGGQWASGSRGGLFAVDATSSPSRWYEAIGFRCVTLR
jgi:formylglycine-generating enzyme required for sulfatase activity